MQKIYQKRHFIISLSVLYSLICPGLGLFYNNNIILAFISTIFFESLTVLWVLARTLNSFTGLIIVIGITGVTYLSILAISIASSLKSDRNLKWYYCLSYYLLVIALLQLVYFALGDTEDLIPHYKSFRMTKASMSPTIAIGDLFIANVHSNKLVYKRRDVVVVKSIDKPGRHLILRIVGVPKDTISVIDSFIIINKDTIANCKRHIDNSTLNMRQPIILSNTNVLLLNDNCEYASNANSFNLYPTDSIIGKPLYIYWSNNLKRIGKEIK